MKFSVFAKISGQLVRLFKVHRSPEGLYVVWPHPGIYEKMQTDSPSRGDHLSYHSDGKSWDLFIGKKSSKRIRQPLDSFEGAETLFSAHRWISPQGLESSAYSGTVKPQDVVAERVPQFSYEVILSSTAVSLPPTNDRLNSVVFQKTETFPIITIEFYDLVDRTISINRYPPATKWIEGVNLWFDDTSRIP